jgi:phage shock protein E
MTEEKIVIDVRTPGEFMGGHIEGSLNIPLHEIPARLDEIMSMQQPLLLCCASGGRSAQATAFLRSRGVDCENAGSWKLMC